MTKTGLAYAKINLSLDIISKMPDGYHNLKMVMQGVGLCDEITIDCRPGKGITVTDPGFQYLPCDERNIAVKAAKAFYGHTGITGYKTGIRIKKSIPVGAGLGGGSADGACVLRMMDEMFGTGLDRETLIKLGSLVGSDVPFCIFGGTKLAEGRGEVLTDLTPIPQCRIVICKPWFSCSTPELFKRVNCKNIRMRPHTEGLTAALEKGDLGDVARHMYNVFEDALPRGRRDVEDIKYKMLDCGALGSAMTGSGPSVFGLFDNEENAQKAYEKLKPQYRDCFLTQTVK